MRNGIHECLQVIGGVFGTIDENGIPKSVRFQNVKLLENEKFSLLSICKWTMTKGIGKKGIKCPYQVQHSNLITKGVLLAS